jgi:hypothetical protein
VARVAKLVLALAGLGLVAGAVGLLVAAGLEDWSDVAEGVRDYALRVQRGQPLLGPLALTLLGIALALLGVSLHRRATFRRTRTARHRAAAARVELRDLDRGLERSRRRLDRELTRARRDPERALEALFTTFTELEPGAVGLELAPDPSGMAIAVTAELRGGKRQPLASTSDALLQRIVERLGEMLETRGRPRGELEFRTASGSTTIRVEVEELERGHRLRLRPAPDLTGPGRRVTFVARPDRTPIPERSGSYSVDDSTSRESGLLLGLDPTGEEEVAPVVASRERRPVVGLEAALRLLAALALAACVALAAGSALRAGWRRLRSGERTAPWREVVVQIESLPTGAEVSIDGAVRGQTPLARRELCKGRALSVLISAAGHRTWQWRGICPTRGALRLQARLQPR